MHQVYLWKAEAVLTPDGWKGTQWTVLEQDDAGQVVRSKRVEGLEPAKALYERWQEEAKQTA